MGAMLFLYIKPAIRKRLESSAPDDRSHDLVRRRKEFG